MKYMGSKRTMLKNGLGHLLRDEAASGRRFVDLFTGSGAVASFVAQNCDIPVLAVDIQAFAVALARAVVARTDAIDVKILWSSWASRAEKELKSRRLYSAANAPLPNTRSFGRTFVTDCRGACENANSDFQITQAYGGHYFSPHQAYWFDALRLTLPTTKAERYVALAALIGAASQCAASPGHTAQPFQPTSTAKQFLLEAWNRPVLGRTHVQLAEVARQFAQVQGRAIVSDANKAVAGLREGDIVFIDPPYSGVHYSRFYHVLETVCRGGCGEVTGVGRYPPTEERPQSKYSRQSEARDAVSSLLKAVAAKGATAIVTFPDKKCSNGISSYHLRQVAREFFSSVQCKTVQGRFSTLGGDGSHREARQASRELIMTLRP